MSRPAAKRRRALAECDPTAGRVLRACGALCVAGLAPPGSDDLHGRARADAALARNRGDRRAGTPRRGVRTGHSRRVLPRPGLVARLDNCRIRDREACPRAVDDRNDLPGIRSRAPRRSTLVCTGRGNGSDRGPGVCLCADPRRRAACVSAVHGGLVADRARARRAQLESGCRGCSRVRRRSGDADAAGGPVRGTRARPSLARLDLRAGSPLAIGLEPLGLDRRRSAHLRVCACVLRGHGTRLEKLARHNGLLQGPDLRPRHRGHGCASDRYRDSSPARRHRRAGTAEGRAARSEDACLRHDERRCPGRLRLVRGDQGRVHLNGLRHASSSSGISSTSARSSSPLPLWR